MWSFSLKPKILVIQFKLFQLLYQDSDIPVQYTYSLPTNVVPGPQETYAWTFDEFTPCSQTCGGG